MTKTPIPITLKATNARDARLEAKQYAPCRLTGFNANGTCVYITAVREQVNKAPVATAVREGGKAIRFIASPELPEVPQTKLDIRVYNITIACGSGLQHPDPQFTEVKVLANNIQGALICFIAENPGISIEDIISIEDTDYPV